MDDKRRSKLKEALSVLSGVSNIVNTICDKEQDCVDNYPENLQGTDKFEQMENAVDSLNDALEKIDDAKECISLAIG